MRLLKIDHLFLFGLDYCPVTVLLLKSDHLLSVFVHRFVISILVVHNNQIYVGTTNVKFAGYTER